MFFANTLIAIAKVIQKQIDAEEYDLKTIQSQLLNLQMDLEMEKITEEEYNQKESILLKKISTAQKIAQEKK